MSDATDGGLMIRGADTETWFRSLGLPGAPGIVQAQVADLFAEVLRPVSESAYLRSYMPTLPDGMVGLQVLRSRIYIRATSMSRNKGALVAGLIAEALGSGLTRAAIITLAAALVDNLSRVSEEQAEVLRVMHRLKGTHSSSDRWLEEDSILGALPDRRAARRILVELGNLGLVEGGAGLWRSVP